MICISQYVINHDKSIIWRLQPCVVPGIHDHYSGNHYDFKWIKHWFTSSSERNAIRKQTASSFLSGQSISIMRSQRVKFKFSAFFDKNRHQQIQNMKNYVNSDLLDAWFNVVSFLFKHFSLFITCNIMQVIISCFQNTTNILMAKNFHQICLIFAPSKHVICPVHIAEQHNKYK